jgi:CMP-N,N'-diacetyllegionaminic acid synthase
MKRICTICARGGSKGVKNKNIRVLNGIPLIAHTIIQARDSKLFDIVAVSSDSDEILEVAKKYGVDLCIKRPDELASDKAAKIPVIRHCVESVESQLGLKFDICVDLDCTSPLRIVDDIVETVRILEEEGRENMLTAMPSRRSPYFNLLEKTSDGRVVLSKPLDSLIVRRQDSPETFDMNGSVYVWRREVLQATDNAFLKTTGLYLMPEERSIDIDTEVDFDFVAFMMAKKL